MQILSVIILLISFYGIYFLFSQGAKKRKKEREEAKVYKEQTEIKKQQLKNELIDFAIQNNRIRLIHYDIEEGGCYHSKHDRNDIEKVNEVIDKHFRTAEENHFSHYIFDKYYCQSIKNEILKLPISKNTYLGFD
jgi:hypothetical protein